MRPWLAAALLMLSWAGDGHARIVDDRIFCATLRQLLAGAGERPAFVSPGRPEPALAAVGLGFEQCRIEALLYGNQLVCTRPVNPRYATGAAPEVRIAHCLPEALRMSEPEGSRLFRFRLGTLAFNVEHGDRLVRFNLFALPIER